jgi:hypothetical protein
MSDPVDYIQFNETHPEKLPQAGKINLFWHKLTGKIGFKKPDGSTSVLEPVDAESVAAAIADGPAATVTGLSNIIDLDLDDDYTLTIADSGNIYRLINSVPVVIGMPSDDPGGNFSVAFVRQGTGSVTFDGNGSDLLSYNDLTEIAGLHAWASVIRVGLNQYNLSGTLA